MNNAQHPAIAVENLRKTFGSQRVLNGITFYVSEGETVAVIGQSGGGKSVMLKLLIGLQMPDSGSIRIADEEITQLDDKELNNLRKRIGFLFQQAALYDSLSVAENVAFPLTRHSGMSADKLAKRVRDLLGEVGMDRESEKLPSQLSGGMQKRVGLARALALDPDILLFDEPTAGLDPITAAEIGNLIVGLKRKRQLSAIVVTHDVYVAKAYSDRMLLLHEGRIKIEGSFDELEESKEELVSKFFR